MEIQISKTTTLSETTEFLKRQINTCETQHQLDLCADMVDRYITERFFSEQAAKDAHALRFVIDSRRFSLKTYKENNLITITS